jgi:hypothetical protein
MRPVQFKATLLVQFSRSNGVGDLISFRGGMAGRMRPVRGYRSVIVKPRVEPLAYLEFQLFFIGEHSLFQG